MSKKSTTLKIYLYLLFFIFLFPAFMPVFATSGASYEIRVIDQTKYVDKYFEVDQNGNFKANIYLGDQKLGVVDNNGIDYYITDHLGSPVIVTDQAGQVVETNDYESYGQLKNTNTQIDNPYKYTGKELDTETNLQYYGARYYDNRIGRLTSVDPATLKVFSGDLFEKQYGQNLEFFLSDPQNLNGYSYTINNPLKNTDSDGEIVETVVDVGFVTYDTGNTLYKGSQFVDSLFSGDFQKVSDASNAFLSSFVDLSVDAGATLIPFVPAGLTRVDDAAKLVNKVKDFDALAQQSKMLKGIENSKVVNTIKDVFRKTDTIPGGTMGAIRNEVNTGRLTKGIDHAKGKATNTINRIGNIFKTENLNKVETSRLQGIRNSLQSLIKHIK